MSNIHCTPIHRSSFWTISMLATSLLHTSFGFTVPPSLGHPHTDLQADSSLLIRLTAMDPESPDFQAIPSAPSSNSDENKNRRRGLSTLQDEGSNLPPREDSPDVVELPPPPKSINEIVEKVTSGDSKTEYVAPTPVYEEEREEKRPLAYERGGLDDLRRSGSARGEDFEYGGDREKHYNREGAKKYLQESEAEAAQKGDRGYKKEQGYSEDERRKHGQQEKKAVISEKEGHEKGHDERENLFDQAYRGKEAEKGISLSKKGGHKKASKKKGFHKVHHKDEYKTDEVFYDEEHNGDEHEEHKKEHEKHANQKGQEVKKENSDSAYHEGLAHKKDVLNKGHTYKDESAHKKQAAKEQFQKNQEEFDKKAAKKEGSEFGHAEKGASGAGGARF